MSGLDICLIIIINFDVLDILKLCPQKMPHHLDYNHEGREREGDRERESDRDES